MTMNRREFLRGLGLTGAAGLVGATVLGACGPRTTASSTTVGAAFGGMPSLKVGYLPITDATPLLAAHAKGYFQQRGLEVEKPTLLRSWSQVAEAFQSRQIDIAHFLMPMTMQMKFGQDVPLKVVAWNHTGGSALTVGNHVESIEALAGTTVAVPFWYSIHNVAVQMLLKGAGLTSVINEEPSVVDQTVKLVVMAPPDMPPALANGAIAGYIVADPFNSVAEVNGIGKILRFTGDMWLDHACCVTVMHEDALAERPEWSQAAISAVVQASAFARENRAETATLLSDAGGRYLPQPEKAIIRSLTHYDKNEYGPTGAIQHLDWDTSRIGFQPFPYESYTTELASRLQSTKVDGDRAFLDALNPADVHAELVDDRFVRQAITELGGPSVFGQPNSLTRTEMIDV